MRILYPLKLLITRVLFIQLIGKYLLVTLPDWPVEALRGGA
jgi:hypothetical protein